MSEEIASADSLIRCNAALTAQLRARTLQIAQLHTTIRALETSRDQWREKAHQALEQLRQARDELEKARAIRDGLRGIQVNWPPLTAAVAAYDDAMKARDG